MRHAHTRACRRGSGGRSSNAACRTRRAPGRKLEIVPYLDRTLLCFQVIQGNTNTYLESKHELEPPLWASKIRFLPYSYHRRTVCMRVELYGCYWSGKLFALANFRETCRARPDRYTRAAPDCPLTLIPARGQSKFAFQNLARIIPFSSGNRISRERRSTVGAPRNAGNAAESLARVLDHYVVRRARV